MLWTIRRDVSRRESLRAHLLWALLTGLAWALSFVIPFQTPLRLCAFLRWTDYPCMFCGFTRSIAAISQGAWAFALHNAPAALVLYLVMVGAFVWNSAGLASGAVIVPGRAFHRLRPSVIIIALSAVVLANWIYRLHLGLK